LAKTEEECSEKLETALLASRGGDLRHGAQAAYLHGYGT